MWLGLQLNRRMMRDYGVTSENEAIAEFAEKVSALTPEQQKEVIRRLMDHPELAILFNGINDVGHENS